MLPSPTPSAVAPRTRSPVVRTVAGYAVATLGAGAVALALVPWRTDLTHTLVAFALLVPVVCASWLGGVGPGIVAAVVSSALFNALFLPPFNTFGLERTEFVVVFLGFVGISVLITWLVGIARDRATAAEEREAEVRLLFDLSHMLVTERTAGLTPALGRAAERLGYVAATVRDDPPGAADRERAFPLRVGDALVGTLVFVGSRPPLTAAESRVVRTFADEVALVVQAERLEEGLRDAELYRRSEDVRRALLAAASHELKSPVAAITASVTDLLGRTQLTDAAARDVLTDIRASSASLEQLITNLLDMSRIEAGTLVAHADPVHLDELIGPAVDRVADRVAGVRFEIDLDDDATVVVGDTVFLERIVTNLAENAARAARGAPDRRIAVQARRDGDRVRVDVIDHGPGLAFGDQELLFTPFYRMHEGGKRLGAGLGLAICMGFVTAMGGTIWATDTPGGGTTISFDVAAATP